MKIKFTINLQAALLVAVLMLAAGLMFVCSADYANAQTPAPRPNVVLTQTSGIYPIRCMAPPDADMAQICFVRTDLADPVELGCTPAGPSVEAALDLNVIATADDDAEIRCYAVDTSGLVGDYSENAGLVDFTRPSRPFVVSTP